MPKGELVWAKIPKQANHDQSGLRPCVVISPKVYDISNRCVIVPLTTNLSSLRFEHSVEVKATKENNLEKDSVALVIQMRTIDNETLVSKIGNLEKEFLNKIDEEIKKMLGY